MPKMNLKIRWKELGVFAALAIAALVLFYIPWEAYVEIQSYILFAFSGISIAAFAFYLCRREYLKAILAPLLPQLAYSFINYSKEALEYGTHLREIKGELGQKVLALMSINLSLADLKIAITVIGIILWVWVWKKMSSTKPFNIL